MAQPLNTFCWHGLVSTDIQKAAVFYPKVLGWELQEMPMGDSIAQLFAAGGIGRAHISAPMSPDIPSHWENYLRVADVDASAQAAVANGGSLLVPPTDIPPGRFAAVASPSGAVLHLFLEASPSDEPEPPAGVGSIHWVELHSQSLQADLTWLTSTFGFTLTTMDMGNGQTYYVLHDGEEQCGGVLQASVPGAPSMWMTWFQIANIEASRQQALEAGGKTLTDIMEMPGVGRMTVVADDTGAVFGIIAPAK